MIVEQSDEVAKQVLRDLKLKGLLQKKQAKKKSPSYASFNVSGHFLYPITTTSSSEVLKFIFSEILHDIDKRSPAAIKGLIAEAGEWLAQAEPNMSRQKDIRNRIASMMKIKSHKLLITAVGSFAASMKETT